MQIGFIMFEVGYSRAKNTRCIIYRSLADMFICGLIFYGIGYNYAYGENSGLIGATGFGFFDTNYKDIDYRRWVMGFCYCSTTLSITTSALAERTYLDTYFFYSITMSSLLFPVLSYWVWGSGWLHQMGYADHGGSGVVHMTAGFSGMIGNYILGPRLGIFKNRTPERKSFSFTRA